MIVAIETIFAQVCHEEIRPAIVTEVSGDSTHTPTLIAKSGEVFKQNWAARGMAIGDIDNDGRLDAVVTTNDGSAHLVHNEISTSSHWLTIRLVGHRSNRDGIGALIKVTNESGSQFAMVSTAGSYLSSSDKRAHFGLGKIRTVKTVEVRWPSGVVQRVEQVQADQQLTIEEPTNVGTAR